MMAWRSIWTCRMLNMALTPSTRTYPASAAGKQAAGRRGYGGRRVSFGGAEGENDAAGRWSTIGRRPEKERIEGQRSER